MPDGLGVVKIEMTILCIFMLAGNKKTATLAPQPDAPYK